jgi:hypothetical protein
MGAFYTINAPWAFGAVWRAIQPWQDEVTASKVKILGGEAVYRPELLRVCEKEALSKEFGGEWECPGGCSLSDVGPWNPSGGGSETESEGEESDGERERENKSDPDPHELAQRAHRENPS